MPTGPNGERRPSDINANAVLVAKIATKEVEEQIVSPVQRQNGRKGGLSRAKALTPEQRTEIARKGARARWGKS